LWLLCDYAANIINHQLTIPYQMNNHNNFRCITTIDVQWGDMDEFHHVNNVIYFRYFETARVKHLEAIGFADFAKRSDGPVVANMQFNYRQPVTYPARLDVGVRATEMRTRSFSVECVMLLHGTETVVADGTAVLVWVDKATGKPVALPEDLRAGITALDGIV
jgi:acyl-CoA thioester hydrolase